MTARRILIVDDHPVVRQGYRRLIEADGRYRVEAEAGSAREAYAAYRAVTPDLVLMDLSLPGASGIEATRHLCSYDPRARILVFTMHQGAAFAMKAIEAGACGYVTKSSDPTELIAALDRAFAGRRVISADVLAEIADAQMFGRPDRLAGLTPRQTEVLRLVAAGLTSTEIAGALGISIKTVQNTHYEMKTQLDARTDAQLVWIAIEAGLLTLPFGIEGGGGQQG
jgi:two-component system, NarL family, invasion response regulator UvrY